MRNNVEMNWHSTKEQKQKIDEMQVTLLVDPVGMFCICCVGWFPYDDLAVLVCCHFLWIGSAENRDCLCLFRLCVCSVFF